MMSVDVRRSSKRNSDSTRQETQLFNPDENWGENTTAVTGATSDAGFSLDEDYNGMHTTIKPDCKRRPLECGRTFSRSLWLLLSAGVWLSPIAMLVLPKALSSLTRGGGTNLSRGGVSSSAGVIWRTGECSPACESQLVAIACKLFVLAVGCWALFLRKRSVQLPRVFVFRAVSMLLILLVTFAFWLFYGVRVFEPKIHSYDTIVIFASSFIDSLLFLHYFAVILIEVSRPKCISSIALQAFQRILFHIQIIMLIVGAYVLCKDVELRHLKAEFVVRVTRSPDGASRTYSCGALSVQRLAAFCLERYYRDFAVYNPYLETLSHTTPKPTEFKFYNVDGVNCGEDEQQEIDNNGNSEEIHSRAIFAANARRRDAKHNDRFYEEQDYESFHCSPHRALRPLGPAIPMDAEEAAQAIFPSMARSLQKYLRLTRQQPNYKESSIMKRLADAVSKDESPRAFLQLYLQQAPLLWNEKTIHEGQQTWTLTSDNLVNQSIVHGTDFTVSQSDVTLTIEVKALPSLNILERMTSDHKFVLRLNSETSV